MIGSLGEFQVILVVHTLRDSEDVGLIRIVSAQKATRKKEGSGFMTKKKKTTKITSSTKPVIKTMTPEQIFDKPLSKARRNRIAAMAALPDESIDTGDIPEVTETTGWTRNPLYRPVTRSITIRLNAPDIVVAQALSKKKGMPYQTFIRNLLHEALQRELTPRR